MRATAILLCVLQTVLLQSASAATTQTIQGNSAQSYLDTSVETPGLAQAYNEARYAIRAGSTLDGKLLAQTPAHGMRSGFSGTGLQLNVQTPDAQHYNSKVRVVSIGYGTVQHPIAEGTLSSAGNRVTIDRNLLSEWFVNRPTGLEQGFTIPSRPAHNDINSIESSSPLSLVLELNGDLTPKTTKNRQAVELVNSAGNTVLHYEGLRVWDADGQQLAANMHARGPNIVIDVADNDASYPLIIDPTFTQRGYLKASNTGPGDNFGWSVATDGDTAVIGAPGEDDGASNSGAVYVFKYDSGINHTGVWSQQAYLKASTPGGGDSFGSVVSIDGDTIVVGAPYESSNSVGVDGDESNDSATYAGAVYVFVHSAGSWSQQAYLKASNTEWGDYFGESVSVSGDTIVAGAPREDGSSLGIDGDQSDNLAERAGAAYVFTRNSGIWSQQSYLKASDTTGFDNFGSAVAVDGDTIIVGAPNEETSETDSGAAYIFNRTAGIWSQQQKVKASNADAYDNFGISVALSAGNAVVGAFQEDSNTTGINSVPNNSTTNSGAAYVFTYASGSWSEQAYLKPSNTASGHIFGYNVAIDGDTLLIGSRHERSNATGVDGDQAYDSLSFAGAAYVFSRDANGWNQIVYLKASNTGHGDEFGYAVGIGVDMYGGITAVVSTPYEDSSSTGVDGDESNNNAPNSGAAYVYKLPPGYPYALCGNITSANHTFNFVNNGWSATARHLHIGSTAGDSDIYASNALGANTTAHAVTGLPVDGSDIYVTLYSMIDGASQAETKTCTTTSSGEPSVFAPLPGSTIAGNNLPSGVTQTIKWKDNGTSVTDYWLYVGSSLGGRQIHNSGNLGTGTSHEVVGIPANGRRVYVRLWYSQDNEATWDYIDVTYRSRNNDNNEPYLTDPPPGASLGDGSYAVWIDDGPNDPSDRYRIYAGANYGSNEWTNSYNIAWDQRNYPIGGWSTSDYGRTVWVRFLWRKNGQWKRSNHSYVAGFGPAAIAGEETRPVPVGQ